MLWIHIRNQRPRELLSGRCAKAFCLWMGRYKYLLTIFRSWIIGVTGGHLLQYGANLLQKLLTLLPTSLLNNYSRGVAVEACVIGQHRHDMFGLIGQIVGTPWPRYHN